MNQSTPIGPAGADDGARRPSLATLIAAHLSVFVLVATGAAGYALLELDRIGEAAQQALTRTLPETDRARRQALDLSNMIRWTASLAEDTDAEQREQALGLLEASARQLGQSLPPGGQGSLDSALGLARELADLGQRRSDLLDQRRQLIGASRDSYARALRALNTTAAAEPDQALAVTEELGGLMASLLDPVTGVTSTGAEAQIESFKHTLAGLISTLRDGPAPIVDRHAADSPLLVRLLEEFAPYAAVFDLSRQLQQLGQQRAQARGTANALLQSLTARVIEHAPALAAADIRQLAARTHHANLVLSIALGTLLLAVLTVTWIARNWLLRPLRGLSSALDQLGRGDFQVEPPRSAIRELSAMGAALCRFGSTLGEVARLNDRLTSQIEQRRRSEQNALRAQRQTMAALDSIHDGFVLFDRDARLVLSNGCFQNLYPLSSHELRPGTPAREILVAIRDRGLLVGIAQGDDEWLERELLQHKLQQPVAERQLASGAWVSVHHFQTGEGGLVCLHTDITQRKQAELALERRNQVLQLLRDLAVVAGDADDLFEALRACMARICRFSGFEVAHAFVADHGRGPRLAWTDLWHLTDPVRFSGFRETRTGRWLQSDLGLPGLVLHTGRPQWISDIGATPGPADTAATGTDDAELQPGDCPRRAAARACGLRAGFAFPVLEQDQVVTVLEFYSTQPLPADPELLETLSGLSVQLGRLTERQRALTQRRILFRALEQNPSAIVMTDAYGRVEYVNPRFTEVTGYSAAEVLGRKPDMFGTDSEQSRDSLQACLAKGLDWHGELCNRTRKGGLYWTDNTVAPVRDDAGRISHWIGIAEDITESKRSAQRIEHLAFYDSLTGLPNRALFQSHLRQNLARGRRDRQRTALLLIDLDDFKDVNDSLGHDAGDQLLQRVGNRLQAALRECDLLARLGGDEFAVLLTIGEDAGPAANVARRTIDAIAKPFTLDGEQLFVQASVGISTFPEDGADASQLLKNAELALYRGKDQGKGQYHFYAPELDASIRNRKSIESDLRAAISANQLQLWYQPQVDVRTRLICGAEALMRWQHPQRGQIAPQDFIPVAEQSGLIVAMGAWALRTACQQIALWKTFGLPSVNIAVNLSAVQFRQEDLVATVSEAMEQTKIDPSMLTLEITESMVMQDDDRNVAVLRRLRELGVKVSLDDFGTGYSSLSYLSRFPIDKIKIDRSFVREVMQDQLHQAVIAAVVNLGQVLNVKVNVEGVETQEQFDLLRAHQVDEVQGFYFSKPVPPEEFGELLLLNAAVASRVE